MESLTGILLLATFVEGFVKYVINPEFDGRYIRYGTLFLGVLISIAYRIDLLAMVGLVAFNPYIGYVISGLIIGRGSNYINDIMGVLKK